MPAKRVVVADEHPTARMAIRLVLEQKGYSVVAEADNCRDALALVRTHGPDLLIIDVSLPGLDALEVVKRVSGKTDTRTIVLTDQPAEKYAARSRSAGAAAYVTKSEDLARLSNALDAVAAGETLFPEGY